MKNAAITAIITALLVPNIALAALTGTQINAILGLLTAFGVEQTTIDRVEQSLLPESEEKSSEPTNEPSPDQNEPQDPKIEQSDTLSIPQEDETMPEQDTTPSPTYEIEVISPIPGKGLGRQFVANPRIGEKGANSDESNYIDLGFVVRDTETGESNRHLTAEITATDESQNKTLNGASNFRKPVTDRSGVTIKKAFYFYPYHYEFKTAGQHTITFKADGQEKSVTLDVNEAPAQ